MDLSSPELLIAAASMLTAIVAVFRSFSQSRKDKNDATLTITQSYSGLIDDYQEQLKEVKEDNNAFRKRIKSLEEKAERDRQHILKLELQLSQAFERISVLEGENETLKASRTHE